MPREETASRGSSQDGTWHAGDMGTRACQFHPAKPGRPHVGAKLPRVGAGNPCPQPTRRSPFGACEALRRPTRADHPRVPESCLPLSELRPCPCLMGRKPEAPLGPQAKEKSERASRKRWHLSRALRVAARMGLPGLGIFLPAAPPILSASEGSSPGGLPEEGSSAWLALPTHRLQSYVTRLECTFNSSASPPPPPSSTASLPSSLFLPLFFPSVSSLSPPPPPTTTRHSDLQSWGFPGLPEPSGWGRRRRRPQPGVGFPPEPPPNPHPPAGRAGQSQHQLLAASPEQPRVPPAPHLGACFSSFRK